MSINHWKQRNPKWAILVNDEELMGTQHEAYLFDTRAQARGLVRGMKKYQMESKLTPIRVMVKYERVRIPGGRANQ